MKPLFPDVYNPELMLLTRENVFKEHKYDLRNGVPILYIYFPHILYCVFPSKCQHQQEWDIFSVEYYVSKSAYHLGIHLSFLHVVLL